MLKALKHIISLSFLPSQWLNHAMFLVLLVAQLVYIKFPATPPYEELDNCLQRNLKYHTDYNGKFIKEIIIDKTEKKVFLKPNETIEDLTKAVFDFNAKAYSLTSWLEMCKDNVVDYGINDLLHSNIRSRLRYFHAYMLELVVPEAHMAMNRWSSVNQFLLMDSVLTSSNKYYSKLSGKELRTLLTALQLAVALDEQLILYEINVERSGCWMDFSAFLSIAIPSTLVLYPGQYVNAIIFIAENNKYANVSVDMMNEGIIDTIDEGVAFWQAKAKDLGVHIVHGYACMNLDTMTINQPWSFQYLVLEKGISLQGDKMNTLYTGVHNPVTISVPGYPLSALSLRVPGASVAKLSDGHYTISVPQKKKDILYGYIDARNTKGTVSTVHGMELHVKELPPPVATIAGVAEGDVLPLVQLLQVHSIGIAQRDTEMDMEYNLRSYQIGFITRNRTYYTGAYTITGNDWTTIPELKEILQQLQPGDRVIVSDIEATDSRGVQAEVPPASYTIQ